MTANPVITEQMLAPWIKAGALSFYEQDDEYIVYKTHPGKTLFLPKRFPSSEELFETIIREPHFREVLHKFPRATEILEKTFPKELTTEATATAEVESAQKGERLSFDEKNKKLELANELTQQEIEKFKLENERIKLETWKSEQQFRLENERLRQAQKFREDYAPKMYYLVLYWIVCLAVLTLLSRTLCPDATWPIYMDFSDTLLMALWGSVTVSILGLFLCILKYLFPSLAGGKSESDEK